MSLPPKLWSPEQRAKEGKASISIPSCCLGCHLAPCFVLITSLLSRCLLANGSFQLGVGPLPMTRQIVPIRTGWALTPDPDKDRHYSHTSPLAYEHVTALRVPCPLLKLWHITLWWRMGSGLSVARTERSCALSCRLTWLSCAVAFLTSHFMPRWCCWELLLPKTSLNILDIL